MFGLYYLIHYICPIYIMKALYFTRLLELVDEFFSKNTTFRRKRRKCNYYNEDYFLIFYHSPITEVVRIYIVDTLTKKHLKTYYYDFKGYKKCISNIKMDIRKLINKIDGF